MDMGISEIFWVDMGISEIFWLDMGILLLQWLYQSFFQSVELFVFGLRLVQDKPSSAYQRSDQEINQEVRRPQKLLKLHFFL